MIKLIGTILVLNVSLAFGQETSHDTLTVVSTSEIMSYPFGMFKNYEHLKNFYPEYCSKKDGFCYLKDGNSYVKLIRDNNTESLRIVYATIHSPKIKLSNGIELGMNKRTVLSKFTKTVPTDIDAIEVLRVEFVRGGIWQYYKFENGILNSICFDTSYQGDKN